MYATSRVFKDFFGLVLIKALFYYPIYHPISKNLFSVFGVCLGKFIGPCPHIFWKQNIAVHTHRSSAWIHIFCTWGIGSQMWWMHGEVCGNIYPKASKLLLVLANIRARKGKKRLKYFNPPAQGSYLHAYGKTPWGNYSPCLLMLTWLAAEAGEKN